MTEIMCPKGSVIVSREEFDALAEQFGGEVDPQFIGALEDLLRQYVCSLLCQKGCHAGETSPDHVKEILFNAFKKAQELGPPKDQLIM